MRIHLLQEEQDNALHNALSRLARHHDWELRQDALYNPEESGLKAIQFNTASFEPAQIILISIRTQGCFQDFVDAYRDQICEHANYADLHVFSPVYDHSQAASVAGLKTLHYLVAPDNENDLEAYLLNISGQAGSTQDNIASLLHGEFAQVIDYSAIISMTDPQGTITYANDNFCQVSGYTREELIGQNHSLLKSGRHIDSKYQSLWQTISSGEPWHGYFCNRCKNGDEYWVDSVIYPIKSANDTIASYISVRYDVTQEMRLKARLIESDKRFRISHSFANIGSWDWNIENGGLYWSDEIHKLFGYEKPVLETSYENFINAVHPEDRSLVQSNVDACVNEGKEYSVEHRVVYPDGSVRWLAERGHVIRDKQGKPKRMLGVVSDIHKLKEAQEAAIRAEQLKSAFISTLSHEIRNPLNALAGYNRLIMDLSTSEELKDYTAKVGKIVEHISGILADINLNAKLESGNIIQKLEPVELKTLFAESLTLLSQPEQGIRIIQETISGHVMAEPQHLRQVIVNLLSNACKYNRPQGSIIIRTRTLEQELVRIEIEDSGYGIATEDLAAIFQPYERLSWQKSEIEGLGIGLSICKLLIKGMKGNIGATSEPGKGSTFWIELPSTSGAPDQHSNSKESIKAARLPEKVLVLEDNEFNQEFMKEQLEKLGIEAHFAGNGSEGLKAIENSSYDLVITDLNMPEMGGLEFIKRVRTHPNRTKRQLPIVIISADNSGGERYKEAYDTGFLVKPFALKELIDTLAKKFSPTPNELEADRKHNFQDSTSSVVDAQVMRHFLGDDESSRNRLLSIYLSALEQAQKTMRNPHSTDTEKALLGMAHRLSSSSQSIGATGLAADFKTLERMLRDHAPKEEWIRQLECLSKSSDQVIDYLRHSFTHDALETIDEYKAPERVRILVVDDDAFAIAQISEKLSGTQSVSFVAEHDSQTALSRLEHESFDIVILDIDMPEIDGIQFVRLFAPMYRRQALVIYSGETSLIGPVAELINNYGMHYLGVLSKPSSKLGIYRLLSQYKKDSLSSNLDAAPAKVKDDTIRQCVETGRIQVLYQPQIEVGSRQVISAEALSRLVDDQGKLIPPSDYLSRLEPLGLERTFASKVACIAIQQVSEWQALNHRLRVAINFSMHALEDLELPDRLKQCCESNQVSTQSIIVEVTETALSAHPKLALEVMVRLKLLGFTLSIDDFGTGYSSLDKLQKLPFTEMKLDRSYVSTASNDDVSMALLTSSLGLAQQLNMNTVAEGIETLGDFQLLASVGAQYVQGFYFAKPLTPEQLIEWKEAFNHDSSNYF